VATELASCSVSRGKHKGAYAVEVRLDGELTAAMSTRYKHLVVTAEGNGNRATCEALITHGERGFQIDLRLPNAK
jgi:hypothetical protein